MAELAKINGGSMLQAATMPELSVLAQTANEAHDRAVKSVMDAVHHALVAGAALLQAKEHVSHGRWLPWLAENCPRIGERTCQLYMQVARYREAFELKAKSVSDLSLTSMIEDVRLIEHMPGPGKRRVAWSAGTHRLIAEATTAEDFGEKFARSPHRFWLFLGSRRQPDYVYLIVGDQDAVEHTLKPVRKTFMPLVLPYYLGQEPPEGLEWDEECDEDALADERWEKYADGRYGLCQEVVDRVLGLRLTDTAG